DYYCYSEDSSTNIF
nr:immunoglobulin light chain junction region [Macaca mulatta]